MPPLAGTQVRDVSGGGGQGVEEPVRQEGRGQGGRSGGQVKRTCVNISDRRNPQVGQFSGCCTADSLADKVQNQLNNNLKIAELETSHQLCIW